MSRAGAADRGKVDKRSCATEQATAVFTRRRLLQGAVGAGALVVGARLGGPLLALGRPASWQADLWLAIERDGQVAIVAHRSEMGTGIRTSLPLVVADELGADWSKVRIVQAPGDARYGSQNTDGSRSVRDFYDTMRRAGASVRLLLERAAAQIWQADVTACHARDHAVFGPDNKSLGFGALVASARKLPVPKPEELTFRAPEQRRYVGKHRAPIYDQSDIVTGRATFGLDVKLERMRYAVIWRVPVLGGKIVSYDAKAARATKGVERIIELPPYRGAPSFQALGGLAVVADSTWAALEGRRKLKVKWSPGPNADFDTQAQMKQLVSKVQRPAKLVRELGDAERALKRAGEKVSADYTVPHLAHAAMEPPCAVARVRGNKCEVWAPTQDPQAAQKELARALGLAPKNVTVHVTLLGGGFGRKSKPDYVAEAALVSRAIKRPVKLMWTREDDLRFDYYHTAEAVHIEAGLDSKGLPAAWLQRSAFPPIGSTFSRDARHGGGGELRMGFARLPYPLANLRSENAAAAPGLRIGWLRSVNHIPHAFAECSFVHELALAAGREPLEYLLALIGEPRLVDQDKPEQKYPYDTSRLRSVLQQAARQIGWGRQLSKGSGLGIAVHRSFLSYVGMAIEVEVARRGKVSIPRVEVAIDCGLAINPDRVRSQVEGAVVFAASLALFGEVSARQGKVEQSNFHDYRIARMNQSPRQIHVHIMPSEAPPAGVGEPGVPPFAPALCNAIHAASGHRVRSLPLSKHNLRWG